MPIEVVRREARRRGTCTEECRYSWRVMSPDGQWSPGPPPAERRDRSSGGTPPTGKRSSVKGLRSNSTLRSTSGNGCSCTTRRAADLTCFSSPPASCPASSPRSRRSPRCSPGAASKASTMARGTPSLRTMLPMAQLDAPRTPLWIEAMRLPWKNAVPPSRSITASWRQPMVGLPSTSASMVSCADMPASRSSIPLGPSLGSVRCCVSTAPTPAPGIGAARADADAGGGDRGTEHAGVPAHADQ